MKDPLANYLSQFYNLSVDDKVALDRSPGSGEIDFLDPSLAKEYLEMPRTVKNLAKLILGMREALSQVAENMQLFGKAMEEHVQLIRSIDGAVNTFRAEAQNFAASVKKVIEVIEDFKDKVLEAYNAITSILAEQQSFQQPAAEKPDEDSKIIRPNQLSLTAYKPS